MRFGAEITVITVADTQEEAEQKMNDLCKIISQQSDLVEPLEVEVSDGPTEIEDDEDDDDEDSE